MAEFKMSLEEVSALFKIKYEKLSENVYNSANVLLGRVKKSYNFTGKRLSIAIPQSFAGGVGSGELPTANTAIYGDAQITAKKMYAVVEIDRETIKASLSDEGAFVRATKEVVQKGVESFMRNLSRAMFSDGSGMLGTIASSSIDGNGQLASNTLSISDFKEANFEERDLVDIIEKHDTTGVRSVKASGLEIDKVDVDNGTVTLVGSLPGAPSTNHSYEGLAMQKSLNNDPQGLKGVLDKVQDSTGEVKNYGIKVGRRWKAVQKDVTSDNTTITTDILNEVMLKIKKACGKSPNLIVCSYKQYEEILKILENKVQFKVEARAQIQSVNGALSFSGIQFMSIDGPVGIFPERFVEDDRIYLLNDAHIHIHHRPDFGWFDDDGTVFLRKALSDAYEARYGGYLEVYINPCFHGVITGLL
tara:strand:+ start:247 stop:1497 length:1251 start_codon:yes stop_codon:yes gene_type:complete